jgi:hypothetical protein
MDSEMRASSGLKRGDGMGDFMRFTTDAPMPDENHSAVSAGAAAGSAEELPGRRRVRGQRIRYTRGGGALRLL